MMKKTAIAAIVILLSGCTYYRVIDPATSNVYFTTDIDRSDSGAVVFTDSRTGDRVTVQNSEVTELNHDEYLIGKALHENQQRGVGEEPATAK